MQLLEKAAEYQKSINMAMEEYEEAQKAYDKVNMAKIVIKVVCGEEEIDTSMYDAKKTDFGYDLIGELCRKEGERLESAKMRLAVLIGDKDTVKASQEHAEQPQSNETEKVEETHVEEKKAVEKANTKPKTEVTEDWHSYQNLYNLYINEDTKAHDIAIKYGVKEPTVYGYLKKHGLTDLKKTMRKDAKYCGKCP